MWASVPIATDPNKYDLSVLLALNPIKVYESIISSGTAGTEYGRLPWLALSQAVMSGHTSNAASEGCHSIAQLIMSDLQTSMGDDILPMIVCLRDGKEAVEQLRAMYPEEANNVALDIKTKLGELALQHQASAQHQHPKPKPTGCRCVFFGPRLLPRVMTATEASLWADSATHCGHHD